MSIKTRKEILVHIHMRYKQASWSEKTTILDELVAITGYRRKYAIHLLNNTDIKTVDHKKSSKRNNKYGENIKQALIQIWCAANQICSKRLVPFLPDLLSSLESFGHIKLPSELRSQLLEISSATVDRILKIERVNGKHGLSTTCAGNLLKNQIKIRTFSDWNDVVPGFFEGDLVAHCGTRTDGSFLNTLVLTDIASTWTEFFPLIKKSEANVIKALKAIQEISPFPFLGLDTDNGSEFINYGLLDFCQTHQITFTRARAYKKNDQAHVEEKNGSIVRRLVGYDRYEGLAAYNALSKLYAVLRLYVNFFQPSLKLISKTRDGAKIIKKYDKAKTPYQRLILSSYISKEVKKELKEKYEKLDPVFLLEELRKLQNNFWQHAWKSDSKINQGINYTVAVEINQSTAGQKSEIDKKLMVDNRVYRLTRKPRKPLKAQKPWHERSDLFYNVWDVVSAQLMRNPNITAAALINILIQEKRGDFNMGQVRTMQRRVAAWKKLQIKTTKKA